jgi:phosphoglycolate phosphatase
MILPSLDTLLFDLDGTLTDPKDGITACIQHALTCLGRLAPSADELEWCIGPPLQSSFARLLADASPALAWEAVRLYRERYTQEGIFESALYPGVPEMLGGLRAAGFHLFVATSEPTIFARRVLEHFGFSGLFLEIYGSELDGTRIISHRPGVGRRSGTDAPGSRGARAVLFPLHRTRLRHASDFRLALGA